MSWVSNIIHGRNREASMTKVVGWLGGMFVAASQQNWTELLTTGLSAFHIGPGIEGMLVGLGSVAIKNAIDKTAVAGSPAVDGTVKKP